VPRRPSVLKPLSRSAEGGRRVAPVEPSRAPRYRHLWPGLLLLSTLGILLLALLVWGDHFLSPAPSGGIRRLLQAWPAAQPIPPAATQPAPIPDPSLPRPVAIAGPAGGAPQPDTPGPAGQATVQVLSPEPHPSASDPSAAPPAPAPESPTHQVQVRYALEFGAFLLPGDADRVEARLNQAGFSTVRFRQQSGGALFAVLIEGVRDAEEGQAIADRLRQQGFPQAVVLGGWQGLSVRVGEPAALRAAVTMADKLKTSGLQVRLTAQSARISEITLRHGSFASRKEAEAISREIARLGLPNDVIRVK